MLSNQDFKPADDVINDVDNIDDPDAIDDLDAIDDPTDEKTNPFPTNMIVINKIENFEDFEGESPAFDSSMDTSMERILKMTNGNLPTPSGVWVYIFVKIFFGNLVKNVNLPTKNY